MTLEELYGINMGWDSNTVLRVREAYEPDVVWMIRHDETKTKQNIVWNCRVLWFDGNDVLVTSDKKEN